MTHYPLFFGFRDLIAGDGYVASVAVNGRALLAQEDDGFWMYGVNPGGLAAGGTTAAEAQSEFRNDYRLVLFDIATEAQSFEDFEREVLEFFNATNKPTAEEWEAAVTEVRSGRVDADWLPKRRAETRLNVAVTKLVHPVPSVNAPDEAEIAA
jgi:hypothetical protein